MFKQDDKCVWVPGIKEIDGCIVSICGQADTGNAVVGIKYIVKLPDNVLDKKIYPYTHASAFECHFTPINGNCEVP